MNNISITMILACVFFLIAIALFIILLAQTRKLGKITAICCKLAGGDVDFDSGNYTRPDLGAALKALESVKNRLIWFRDEFERLRYRSSCADISARANEDGLQGIYHGIMERANAYIGSITAYLDVLGTPAFSVDLDYNLVYTNKDACELLGMTADQLAGKKCYDYFRCDKCRTDGCICAKAIREKKLVKDEAKSVYHGTEKTFSQTGVAIMNFEDNYKITAGLEILADVTEIYNLKNSADVTADRTRAQIGVTGAMITEMTLLTGKNVSSAEKASVLSKTAKENALAGSRRMSEMLQAMEEIKNASSGIANIIKTIEDIAFQTNILALNAAVEAARAGEHGKGFAVVAEEVRNLAARSAGSAKETTALIDDTVNKVQKGVQIANETASALDEIVKGISDAGAIVTEIAGESKNQERVITQVEDQIKQIGSI